MAGTTGIRSVVQSIRRSLNLDSHRATDDNSAKAGTPRIDSALLTTSQHSQNEPIATGVTTFDENAVEYQDIVIAGVLLPTMPTKSSRTSKYANVRPCPGGSSRSPLSDNARSSLTRFPIGAFICLRGTPTSLDTGRPRRWSQCPVD
jgi:hypothetical protein